MAQTGYTPISIYYSSTAAATPTAGNLVAGELAINTADGKLFYKDSAGAVQVIGTKGGVGNSSNTQILYNNSGTITGSSGLTYTGSNLTYTSTNPVFFVISTLASSYSSFRLYNDQNSSSRALEIDYAGSTYSGSILSGGPTGEAGAISTTGAYPLLLGTNNTTRITIDSSGNVGIGISTISSGVKLQVNGGLFVSQGNFTTANSIIQQIGAVTGSANQYVPSSISFRTEAYVDVGAIAFNTNAGTGNTERMRIDSSGNVGVGTTSPFGKVDAVGNSYGAFTARATATGANQTVLALSVVDNTYVNFANAVYYAQSHDWRINGTAVGMNIIPAGNLLLGTTTYYGASAHIVTNTSTSVYGMAICDTASTTGGINFLNSSGTQVGAIFINGASVTYATTSDYRLKENVAPMAGALEIVAKLKPVTYTWKSNGLKCQGFIAHELQEIVPECVSGEKDAMEFVEDLDETGKIIGKKEIPKYQGIDTSFLIATLVSAIQEQQAMIEELKAKVAALEAA